MNEPKILGRFIADKGTYDLTDQNTLIPVCDFAKGFYSSSDFKKWEGLAIDQIKNPIDLSGVVSIQKRSDIEVLYDETSSIEKKLNMLAGKAVSSGYYINVFNIDKENIAVEITKSRFLILSVEKYDRAFTFTLDSNKMIHGQFFLLHDQKTVLQILTVFEGTGMYAAGLTNEADMDTAIEYLVPGNEVLFGFDGPEMSQKDALKWLEENPRPDVY